MNPSTSTKWTHLAPKPQSYLRQLFVRGTDFRARDLYASYVDPDEPRTPGQIAEAYRIPVEAVQEAIRYCESNPPEIGQDFADEEAWFNAREWKDGFLMRREAERRS